MAEVFYGGHGEIGPKENRYENILPALCVAIRFRSAFQIEYHQRTWQTDLIPVLVQNPALPILVYFVCELVVCFLSGGG